MGDNTKIEWTAYQDNEGQWHPGFSFNPWIGCTKVSPACDHCYAESWAKRSGLVQWGVGQPRRRTSEANWKKPLKWNREAEANGTRPKVFCASLADVFDTEVPELWRNDLFVLIERTPHLDWLLLTKRPNVAVNYIKTMRPNVWIGTTVENQEMADQRIPLLLKIPATVRFLSCEPLLGPMRLDRIPVADLMPSQGNALTGENWPVHTGISYHSRTPHLDWVIAGGESGPHARPLNIGWVRDLNRQCSQAGVAAFNKQLGHRPYETMGSTMRHENPADVGSIIEKTRQAPPPRGWTRIHDTDGTTKLYRYHRFKDRKGGDWSEWPEDLRVREFPA